MTEGKQRRQLALFVVTIADEDTFSIAGFTTGRVVQVGRTVLEPSRKGERQLAGRIGLAQEDLSERFRPLLPGQPSFDQRRCALGPRQVEWRSVVEYHDGPRIR